MKVNIGSFNMLHAANIVAKALGVGEVEYFNSKTAENGDSLLEFLYHKNRKPYLQTVLAVDYEYFLPSVGAECGSLNEAKSVAWVNACTGDPYKYNPA